MAHAIVLFISTENGLESSFKENLQKKDQLFNVYDVEGVSKMKGGKEYKDKLKHGIHNSTCIIVICSPSMKSYLDDKKVSSNSPKLKKDERKVLLEELQKEDNKKKIILVYLDKSFSGIVPKILQGMTDSAVDGVNDMDTLADKIRGLLK